MIRVNNSDEDRKHSDRENKNVENRLVLSIDFILWYARDWNGRMFEVTRPQRQSFNHFKSDLAVTDLAALSQLPFMNVVLLMASNAHA